MQLPYPIYRSLVDWGAINESPTAALYLLNPIRQALPELISSVRYCGANVYAAGAAHVIVRTTTTRALERLSQQNGRIVYIVDDHFASCVNDDHLPDYYRERIARFLKQQHDTVIELASDIVSSSRALAEEYGQLAPGKMVHMVDPVHDCPAPEFRQSTGTTNIGLLASRSHAADIKHIGPAMCDVVRAHRSVQITHCLRGADLGLPGNCQVVGVKPLRWRRYRDWQPEIHIGLYPLLDTDFNRYRSINKLIEYVNLGAAPLVSDVPAMTDVPLQLRVREEDWAARVNALVSNENLRHEIWQTAARFVAARNPLKTTAECWSRLLSPVSTAT